MNEEILFQSAKAMARLVCEKEISAQELISAHIENIYKNEPNVNAVVQLNHEQALVAARKIDLKIQRGESLGRLAGVPFSIKDTLYAKGFTTSLGSNCYKSPTAKFDATVVSRLKTEGAIPLCMTNVPEMLVGFETNNLRYGRTNNPHNLNYSPGGTSGGEAALISYGGSPLGIASDGSGSIRVPAHNCGIVGMKPSQMLVPTTGFYPSNTSGLFMRHLVFGPMARYVEDIELSLDIIRGADNVDPYTAPRFNSMKTDIDTSILKAGYLFDNAIVPLEPEVSGLLSNALKSLSSNFSQIDAISADVLSQTREIFNTLIFSELNLSQIENLISHFDVNSVSPHLLSTIELFKQQSSGTSEFFNMLMRLDSWRYQIMKQLEDVDVILLPTAATAALKHGESLNNTNNYIFNIIPSLLGAPAITVPCGKTELGLPIGLQIMTKPWQDALCLKVASNLEKVMGGWQKPELN